MKGQVNECMKKRTNKRIPLFKILSKWRVNQGTYIKERVIGNIKGKWQNISHKKHFNGKKYTNHRSEL